MTDSTLTSPVQRLLNWLSKPKGDPINQQIAFDLANQIVEDWKVGWKDEDAEQPDRSKILREALATDESIHLLQVMRLIGPIKAFTEVGADEELAANIFTIGTALKLFQTKGN
jgi:hypothetical protein|tara:strand:- start:10687 stop:11025 length:339 start_codon:yes stop_codon:yes gene_type:complete